jgi:small subunit ribosomal protein S18
MASRKKPTTSRTRGKEPNPRKFKKKTSPLVIEKVEYVDYKNVDLLQRFMSDRAKIRNRRVTGNDVQQQREVAKAIKIAREMALLPYAKRVASSGRGRPQRDGEYRRDADAAPARDTTAETTVTDEVIDEVTDGVIDGVIDRVDGAEMVTVASDSEEG